MSYLDRPTSFLDMKHRDAAEGAMSAAAMNGTAEAAALAYIADVLTQTTVPVTVPAYLTTAYRQSDGSLMVYTLPVVAFEWPSGAPVTAVGDEGRFTADDHPATNEVACQLWSERDRINGEPVTVEIVEAQVRAETTR